MYLREPLVRRQGSQVSMRVARGWVPVSQTGVLCTDWIVLEKSDDAVTLGGYVAPQNDTPFESAVIYQRYSLDDGLPLENGTLAAGEGILIDSLEMRAPFRCM